VEFTDYWHGRPQYMSFVFGGVLFLDLNSSASLLPGSPQYAFVEAALECAPPCIVSFFHIPVLSGGVIATNKQDLWALLANNGGDLVLNGHNHFLMEYEPLAADLTTPGHMVELISGAGGAGVNRAKTDPAGRIAWSLGSAPGSLSRSRALRQAASHRRSDGASRCPTVRCCGPAKWFADVSPDQQVVEPLRRTVPALSRNSHDKPVACWPFAAPTS